MSLENERRALLASRVSWSHENEQAASDREILTIGNPKEHFPEIIGSSSALMSVLSEACRMARSEGSILITGESGTGKELIAKAMHRLSPRRLKKFVAINCSAIPEDLLESELFGHEKGAFTGAISRRAGLFEQAHGGSLFLDEIGEMPLRLQAKLLRVLQEKRFTTVGGTELRNADVRIVAATNINLQEAVENRSFRLDLFYRLNVLPIHLPALSERGTDIIELATYFLKLQTEAHNLKTECTFSPTVLSTLLNYSWPGNIRELQNLVERIVVIKRGGTIELTDLPKELLGALAPNWRQPSETPPRTPQGFSSSQERHQIKGATANYQASPAHSHSDFIIPSLSMEPVPQLPSDGIDLCKYIEELENNFILQALNRTGHNKNQAAKLLGLNRTTLVERLKKRNLPHF